MRKILGVFLVLMAVSGCSSIRKMALKTAAPLFKDSMSGIESEGNWEQFRHGIPGNLTLIDGLLAVRPHDENLLMAAIKGNAGYAFGVYETLYLEDKLKDESRSPYKDQAIAHYSKAFDYGLQFLKANDLDFEDLKNAVKDKRGVAGLLNAQLSSDQVSLEAILFAGQSLAGLINLQRDNLQLISLLPIAKGMFDWVCDLDPNIAHGTCQIFYGSYEAGRPAMLGGNPERGKQIFQSLVKERPDNWLARVTFIEQYAIPQYDENVYHAQKKDLEKFEVKLRDSLSFDPTGKQDPAFSNKQLRLYQAIAIKRYQIIKKYEKEIF